VVRRKHRADLLSRLPRNAIGAEIGTWEGDFAARVLRRRSPRRLYLVDPWEYRAEGTYSQAFFGDRVPGGQVKMDAICEAVRSRFARDILTGRVVIVRARSSDAVSKIDDSLGWVYIDGDHTYDAVRADIGKFYALLEPGGILAGDDYGVAGWWDDGVTRAVDEFVASESLQLTVCGQQFLIRKPSEPDTDGRALRVNGSAGTRGA
jgi:hypothetical protein